MRRKPLGRGLEALIPLGEPESGQGVEEIRIDLIRPNPNQPRRRFAQEPLQELAESIREHGVLEPLIVRPVDDGYEIVVGERRWRASKLAGLTSVPAIVREMDEREATELALVENLQREDLNPIEEAEAYQRLLDEFDLTQDEVAQRVGKDRSTIANRLRLLGLRGQARRWLEEGRLSAGHAKALLSVADEEVRQKLARRVVEEGLSVRQTEQLAKKAGTGVKRKQRPQPERDPHWVALEDEFRRVLGTKVNVVRQGSRGRIEIEFYGEEDIERILAVLRGNE